MGWIIGKKLVAVMMSKRRLEVRGSRYDEVLFPIFADLAEANTYAQNILVSSKIQQYQQSSNPGAALATDLAKAVKRIAVPVNEFSIKGSESDGAVFFDPETLEYKLVAASDGGSSVRGSFIKE